MFLQVGKDVRGHGDGAPTGVSLRWTDDHLTGHRPDDGPFDVNPAVQKVDVPTLKAQDLPSPKLAPRWQKHCEPVVLWCGLRRGGNLRDRRCRTFR
jgi:hypothetical protein